MNEIKIKIEGGKMPEFKTEGAAGADVCALLSVPVVLNPGDIYSIPTGLFIEIPKGFEIQIRARSGLAANHGITLVNGIGTIDSDYRGEIVIPIINLGREGFEIKNGDRIAQMVLSKYERFEFIEVKDKDELQKTDRADGGFGHTGIK